VQRIADAFGGEPHGRGTLGKLGSHAGDHGVEGRRVGVGPQRVGVVAQQRGQEGVAADEDVPAVGVTRGDLREVGTVRAVGDAGRDRHAVAIAGRHVAGAAGRGLRPGVPSSRKSELRHSR
jgi:hypothetical protein